MIKKGMTPFNARKYTMLIFALLVTPVFFAQSQGISTWTAIALISLAASSHQAWSANIFTTVTDMFPKKAVASVTGIGGMAGAVGGLIISQSAGLLLKHFAALDKIEIGYGFLFMFCGVAYVIAWIVMHFLVPKMKRVEDL
jgi:ACS family hexuronate transporter-like MFS transporter